MSSVEVAVIGAGPYGLSLAAHIQHAGLSFRIFGNPMETWSEQMPKGMLLKSDGFASNISDPGGIFELRHFCKESGIPYDRTRIPVSLEDFSNYGEEFQRRILPSLEKTKVTSLEKSGSRFKLLLENGDALEAEKVVVATGISYYAYLPEVFAPLRGNLVLHSSEVSNPQNYAGKSVAIVGSGASAIDLAVLLHEAGANVTVYARRAALRFADAPGEKPRTRLEQLRAPDSGVGPGWKSRLVTQFPSLFRLLPLDYRISVVRRFLGPGAGWPMRDRFVGKVNLVSRVTPVTAAIVDSKAHVTFATADGSQKSIVADIVVCATGYRPSLARLTFLDDALRNRIVANVDIPTLSSSFESSIPGLFFIGVTAAHTFGPVMRFAFGARYAARTVCRYLARTRSTKVAQSVVEKPSVDSVHA